MTKQAHHRMRRFRWVSYVLIILGYMLAYVHRMAPASIATELQRAFNASGAALGSLAASYFYTYMVMQIPVGIMADTLGVRRIVAAGCAIAGFGSLLFAWADTLALASAGRFAIGLGVSFMFISVMKFNTHWFHDRHFGTIAGMTLLLGNLGAVLAAAPLAWLVTQMSWRSVFAAIGAFSLLLAVLVWWLVRGHPGEAGLPTMRELDGQPAHAPHHGHWFDGLLKVMKNRATWPGLWPNLGVGGTLFAFAGLWAVPYLRDVYGMSKAEATGYTTVLMLSFAIGSLLLGIGSDRLGKRRPVLLGALLIYALCWLPPVLGWRLGPALNYALFAVMGASASGFTLSWACAKEVNPPALSGMATSVINVGAFLGAAILQPLVGWVMDRGWDGRMLDGARIYSAHNYQTGLALMLAFAVVGVVGALGVRETYCRYVNVKHAGPASAA